MFFERKDIHRWKKNFFFINIGKKNPHKHSGIDAGASRALAMYLENCILKIFQNKFLLYI